MRFDPFWLWLAGASALSSVSGWAQTTTCVSYDPNGGPGDFTTLRPSISADGRFAAFMSYATNLVPGDTNGFPDIFVHDMVTGVTTRVSVDSSGTQGDANSGPALAISSDGRYIAFGSMATNLVPGDTNARSDVFVRDTVSGTTTRASVSHLGAQGNGSSATDYRSVAISADGRYVAFESTSSNLTPVATNGSRQIFVHDMLTAATMLVSVSSSGQVPTNYCNNPSISADGRYVVFDTIAHDLVPGDTEYDDVFLHDVVSGTTTLVSLNSSGVHANGDSFYPSISGDGNHVAFSSLATNLVPGDTNGYSDIFVRDLRTGVTRRASVDSAGTQSNNIAGASKPAISFDGRFVAFNSDADNLVPGDTNQFVDVFLHDFQTGVTTRVSMGIGGYEADDESWYPTISADGLAVAFLSYATNLTSGTVSGIGDDFVRVFGLTPSTFCFGDNSGTPCPCGNTGDPGNGCANSIVGAGAHLVSEGAASVSFDQFILHGTGMPNGTALYYQGMTPYNGGMGAVFGDGLRCVGGTVVRLGIETNTMNSSFYPDSGDLPISTVGNVPPTGGTRTYQCWYRNSDPSFCTSAVFNLTNGVQVAWVP